MRPGDGLERLVARAELLDRRLRVAVHVEAGRPGADEGVGRVAPVRRPTAAGSRRRAPGTARAGRRRWPRTAGRPTSRRGRSTRVLVALPCHTRIGSCSGPGPRREVLERRAVRARPVDVLLAEQAVQQLVVLGVALPLVVVGVAEDPGLLLGVALADDDLDPPAGDHVERGVVLGDADRVEQRQHGDAGEQPQARRASPRGSRGAPAATTPRRRRCGARRWRRRRSRAPRRSAPRAAPRRAPCSPRPARRSPGPGVFVRRRTTKNFTPTPRRRSAGEPGVGAERDAVDGVVVGEDRRQLEDRDLVVLARSSSFWTSAKISSRSAASLVASSGVNSASRSGSLTP